jgi:hypothetical protein
MTVHLSFRVIGGGHRTVALDNGEIDSASIHALWPVVMTPPGTTVTAAETGGRRTAGAAAGRPVNKRGRTAGRADGSRSNGCAVPTSPDPIRSS